MIWFLIFAGVVFAGYFWRQYRERQAELDRPTAAHRLGLRHIGHAFVLDQPLQDGSARIKIGDREWVVRGPKLPAGAKVRVTGVDGTVLLIDKMAA